MEKDKSLSRSFFMVNQNTTLTVVFYAVETHDIWHFKKSILWLQ